MGGMGAGVGAGVGAGGGPYNTNGPGTGLVNLPPGLPSRDTYVFGLLTLEKGQMMNELCERFYKKYPYEGGKWPDKPSHRRLIDFLDDEKQHSADGVAQFAVSMRLARSVDEYFGDAYR